MTPLVKVRRHQIVNGWYRKTGWRWTCRACPPIRGRARAGFHHDHRFTDSRNPGRYPGAWTRCMRAAMCHIHAKHHAQEPR